MKVTRWGLSAIAALLLAGGAGYAGDTDELNAMKTTMENMKQEMEAMRATMASEREAMRANTGGAPEALKSANGKATVKIGGDFKVRYSIGLENGYNNATSAETPHDNTRYTRTSWDIYKAEINFTIDFTPDTMGYIALRPDRGDSSVGMGLLDEAWWQWKNIGGTGFAVKVGLQTLEIGTYNSYDGHDSPWERAMIWDPFVKSAAQRNAFGANGDYNFAHETDINAIGISASYTWDQVRLVAGIYGQQVWQNPGKSNTLGVTTNGSARNLDIENHYITVYYDPCWLENLHLQASYFGEFDQGGGVNAQTWWPSNYTALTQTNHGATYLPGFDVGASYIADKWAVYAEGLFIANPNYYQDSWNLTFSVGADYSLTEKLKIGGMFDYTQLYGSRFWGDSSWVGGDPLAVPPVPAGYTNQGGTFNGYAMRAAIGARYDFGNGLYVQAQYSHYWVKAWGVSDSHCKDNDQLTFQTGFTF